MSSTLHNLEPLLFRLEAVKDAPLQLGRHDFVVLGRQYHNGCGADRREKMHGLPFGVTVEALDRHAVFEGRGVLLSGVDPGGQGLLLLGRKLGQVFEEHQVLSLVIEERYVFGGVATKLIGPIFDCPSDDSRLVGGVEAPVGHKALCYNGRDTLVKGCGFKGYSRAPEKAPYGYAIRVDPALVLEELSQLISMLNLRANEDIRIIRYSL